MKSKCFLVTFADETTLRLHGKDLRDIRGILADPAFISEIEIEEGLGYCPLDKHKEV